MLNDEFEKRINQLYIIREFLEDFDKKFPIDRCESTSLLLKKLLNLDIVEGVYVPKYRRSENWNYKMHFDKGHNWNYDPKLDLYFDLTQDQFNETSEKIVILPVKNEILKPIQFEKQTGYLANQAEESLIKRVDELLNSLKLYVGFNSLKSEINYSSVCKSL